MNKKAEKRRSNPLEALPDYLGLGVLDPNSVEISPSKISGDYKFENDVVYKVSVSGKDFQIIELLDGRIIARTAEDVSLMETFFHHLTGQLPHQSKRFERLFHRLADDRNVNVRFASEPRFFYYPAGYLFSLREPIVNSNKSILDRVAKSLVDVPDESNLKLSCIREGVIFRLMQTGGVTVEQVRLADFSCTLHRLVNSVDSLWRSGIVPKEKEYQLTVLDSSMAPAGTISIYLGDISRGLVTFSVIVTEGADLDLEQARNQFRDSSTQLLQNLEKQKGSWNCSVG